MTKVKAQTVRPARHERLSHSVTILPSRRGMLIHVSWHSDLAATAALLADAVCSNILRAHVPTADTFSATCGPVAAW